MEHGEILSELMIEKILLNIIFTKTQNLPQYSLKCHPIHPGIHKDPSIGCLQYSNGCPGSSWNSKLAILG